MFLVAEALVEAGVLVGLPRAGRRQLVTRPCSASATLLADGRRGPEALRAAVTSPGGTTAAGLRSARGPGVRAPFIDAVVAATGGRGSWVGRPRHTWHTECGTPSGNSGHSS